MDEIVFDYLPTNERLKWVKNVQRFVLITNLQVLTQAPEIAGMVDEMFAPVLSAMIHTCKKCGHEIYFTKPDLVLFSEKTVMRCDECLTNQFTDDEFYTKFLDAWDDVVPMKLT